MSWSWRKAGDERWIRSGLVSKDTSARCVAEAAAQLWVDHGSHSLDTLPVEIEVKHGATGWRFEVEEVRYLTSSLMTDGVRGLRKGKFA